MRLESADGDLGVIWQAELRDGSNYIRQRISCQAKRKETELTEVVVLGSCRPRGGSPGRRQRLAGHGGKLVFFAAEHPMSKSRLWSRRAGRDSRDLRAAIEVGKSLRLRTAAASLRSLVGVTPEGQLRRGFLYYLDASGPSLTGRICTITTAPKSAANTGPSYCSASPARPRRIAAASNKRGSTRSTPSAANWSTSPGCLDSFVHDQGWDDENLVWQFHDGYPDGFRPGTTGGCEIRQSRRLWFSPFGGYAGRGPRMESGRRQGFRNRRLGLTLAGPRYFARFLAACQG